MQLIYCHGLLGTQDECLPLLQAADRYMEVFRFNFTGHGGNPLGEDWHVARFAADLQAFILHHRIENPVIIGYSLGGYVALYAIIHLKIPCAALMTIGTKWHWNADICRGEAAKLNAEKIAEKAPHVAMNWARIHAPNDWHAMLSYCRTFLSTMPEVRFESAMLTKVDLPVIICVGDADKFVTIEESQYMADQLPEGSFYILPETGHPIERLNIPYFWEEVFSAHIE